MNEKSFGYSVATSCCKLSLFAVVVIVGLVWLLSSSAGRETVIHEEPERSSVEPDLTESRT